MKYNLKETADKLISKARFMFLRDDNLTPVAFSVNVAGQLKYVPLALETEAEQEQLPEMLKELALSAEAIIVIADSFLKKRDPETDEETQGEALMCIIHTRDSSHLRYLTYKKKGDGYPIFFDMGWTDVLEDEWNNIPLSNPFQRI